MPKVSYAMVGPIHPSGDFAIEILAELVGVPEWGSNQKVVMIGEKTVGVYLDSHEKRIPRNNATQELLHLTGRNHPQARLIGPNGNQPICLGVAISNGSAHTNVSVRMGKSCVGG